VMDEPTNDLDIDSLELLEDTLQSYTGTLLLVSHDRAFLDNVVTQTLVAQGDGTWQEYVGGYSDWLAQRRAPAAASMAKSKQDAKPIRAPAAVKLSYKESRELTQLPIEIEAIERRQQELTARMSSGDYHPQSAEQIKADMKLAQDLERDMAEKFDRWSSLEAKAGAAAKS
jgi:ABC transport system ATP-binding/permease protein